MKLKEAEQYEYGYEGVTDSVMTRTLEGRINSWNRPSEELYGWRKEEAIGRVSHCLLQTRFPKPLEEIESELVESGKWEGRLVHTTRDGNQVVVDSRWILKLRGDDRALVEINKRSSDGALNGGIRGNAESATGAVERPLRITKRSEKLARVARYLNFTLAGAASVLLIALIAYGVSGHALIKSLYESDNGFFEFVAKLIMHGRATTRLEEYYYAGDTSFLLGTLYIVPACLLLWGLINEPLGMLVSALTLFMCSLILFTTFEFFPSLITRVGLQHIPYYGFNNIYVPDPILGYRERPFRKQTIPISQPRIGVNGDKVPAKTIEWSTDAEGFRNSDSRQDSDVVLLGDSFVEYGDNIADTLAPRLEKHLNGLTVRNLGKSGYGPFQYLEVLRRYGIERHPRYAVFCFYEGNDISDIQNYMKWKSENKPHEFTYAIGSEPFLQRYIVALKSTVRYIADSTWPTLDLAVQKILGGKHIYPDLVVIRLGRGETYETIFEDKLIAETTEDTLQSQSWIQLKSLLSEFKTLAVENNIKPMIVYIPSVPQVYADYTTDESGREWRDIRARQIISMGQAPRAMALLANQLQIALIDLTPIYRGAAQDGRMLYGSFNVHWNAEGRELAARVIAEKLTSADPAHSPR